MTSENGITAAAGISIFFTKQTKSTS